MDEASFQKAVLEHKDRVYGFAARMLSDREEARDVAQEALVKLWQHRQTIDEDFARAWLFRTANNLCIDRLRQRAGRPQADLEDLDLLTPVQPHPNPAQCAQGRETGRAIDLALARLNPRERAVLLLREVQGLSYGELADLLEVPEGTLKAILHRARERARLHLTAAGVRP